ncbi:MAG: anti-sigma F factor [Pyrinomonadaceae bacterium]
MIFVSKEISELTLPSRIESIAQAVTATLEVAKRAGFGEEALSAIDLAVREAVSNAIVHGNAQDERTPVEIEFSNLPAQFVISVRDRGAGFDPNAVPDPTDSQNLLKPSGRGMLFMRAFMDQVEWTTHAAGGTIVRMTKKKSGNMGN